MSDQTAQLTKALSSIRDLRARLESVQAAAHQPVAVVGMACRFPGAASVDAYWDLLQAGTDAVGDTPDDRWNAAAIYDPEPDHPGTVATRWGGFVDGIDRFDAAFFGIAPREAERMDPQQRLFLETAWHALEDAGLDVHRLAGGAVGVFAGVHSHSSDYYQTQAHDPAGLDLYSGTGTSHSVLTGRLSYLYDLRGPSLTVDTACSSSLVAAHLAVASLRQGECDIALAGGANVMLDPTFTMVASRMRMMSPTGRCRPFDAAGDGFVRAEGAGIVVLKRLDDALAANDRIHGIIRGSAVNQDGRSNGLTAPNSAAQHAVITAALRDAQADPADIGLIEAHGTGTPLGDPIEFEALADAIGRAGEARCAIGSAKANIGHAEGAAGIAGLIKAILCVKHGIVPGLTHFDRLNPHIDPTGTRFDFPTETTAWVGPDRRIAGVSSFGWSGSNAHLVIEAPVPEVSDRDAPSDPVAAPAVTTLPISATASDALDDQISAFRALLSAGAELGAVAATAANRRTHLGHRAVVVGRDADEVIAGLDGLLADEPSSSTARGVADPGGGSLVFVCPGQGAQWAGMLQGLLTDEPTFAASIDRVDAALAASISWSVRRVLEDPANAGVDIDAIDVVQPTLFAVQVALADLVSSWGVEPDLVIGHSLGEVAAAAISGALSLDDAALVIATRSRLLRSIAGQGAMAILGVDLETARRAIGDDPTVSAAVSNSATSTAIAGDPVTVQRLVDETEANGQFARLIKVDVASHSPQVEPLLAELRSALSGISPQHGAVPMLSTVTGELLFGPELTPDYWARNLRDMVRFGDAVDAAAQRGARTFVELGPHPVLAPVIDAGEARLTAIGLLRRETDEAVAIRRAVGELHAVGHAVDWSALAPEVGARVELPRYPFRQDRHWLEARPSAPAGQGVGVPTDPLLGWPLDLADPSLAVWRNTLRPETHGALYEHEVAGRATLAAAHSIEMLRRAVGDTSLELRDVELLAPIELRHDQPTDLQITARPDADGGHSVRIDVPHDGGWQPAVVATAANANRTDHIAPTTPHSATVELAGTDTTIELLHACFDTMQHAVALDGTASIVVPTRLGRLWIADDLPTSISVAVHPARGIPLDDELPTIDIEVTGPDDAVVARLDSVELHRLGGPSSRPEDWFFTIAWAPSPPSEPAETGGSPNVHVCARSASTVSLVESLGATIRGLDGADDPLWVVTQGAVAIGEQDPLDPAHAAVWGFVRAAREEYADRIAGVVDIDESIDPSEAVRLARASAPQPGLVERAIRGGTVFAPSLVASPPAHPHEGPATDQVTHVVTGGFGALGMQLCRRLAERGVGHLALVGRTPVDAESTDPAVRRRVGFLDELRAMGTDVSVHAIDIGDRADVDRLAADLATAGRPPVRWAYHAAGALSGQLIADLEPDALRTELGTKTDGAEHLLAVFPELDGLVLYSSIASILPVAGQSVYAAANAWLDAFAVSARRSGRPVTAVGWGFWHGSDRGDVTDDAEIAHRKTAARVLTRRSGIGAFRSDAALDALELAVRSDLAASFVVAFDWAVWGAGSSRPTSGLLRDLVGAHRGDAAAAATDAVDIRGRILDADPTDRRALLSPEVTDVVARVLKLAAASIEADRPLGALGLDSLTAIELRNGLEARLGVELSATTAWNHPSVGQLTDHLLTVLDPSAAASLDAAPVDVGTVDVGEIETMSDDDALQALLGGDE